MAADGLPAPLVQNLSSRFGDEASQRLNYWLHYTRYQAEVPLPLRIGRINRYLNRLPYIEDTRHWQQPDYWATPLEFVASGGGDCEDFAIAKLFSLAAIGVPMQQLRLLYVQNMNAQDPQEQPHMVLLYTGGGDSTDKDSSDALVLDNLTNDIVPLRERTDLDPVFSLNEFGLWLSRDGEADLQVLEHSGSKLWSDLVQRVAQQSSSLAGALPTMVQPLVQDKAQNKPQKLHPITPEAPAAGAHD